MNKNDFDMRKLFIEKILESAREYSEIDTLYRYQEGIRLSILTQRTNKKQQRMFVSVLRKSRPDARHYYGTAFVDNSIGKIKEPFNPEQIQKITDRERWYQFELSLGRLLGLPYGIGGGGVIEGDHSRIEVSEREALDIVSALRL